MEVLVDRGVVVGRESLVWNSEKGESFGEKNKRILVGYQVGENEWKQWEDMWDKFTHCIWPVVKVCH